MSWISNSKIPAVSWCTSCECYLEKINHAYFTERLLDISNDQNQLFYLFKDNSKNAVDRILHKQTKQLFILTTDNISNFMLSQKEMHVCV